MDSEICPEMDLDDLNYDDLDDKEDDLLLSLVKQIIYNEMEKSDDRKVIPVPKSYYNAIVREFTSDLLSFSSPPNGTSEIVEFWEESGLNVGILRYIHKVNGDYAIALTAGLSFMSKDATNKINELLQCLSVRELTNLDGDTLRSSDSGDRIMWDQLGLDDDHIYYIPDDLLAKLQEVARTLVKVGSL